MGTVFKVLLIIAIVIICLFVISFLIYFFNLDMKLSSKLEPIFLKHYDRVKKDKKKK